MIHRAAIVFALLCASTAASAQGRDSLIVPGERVGPIALGASAADLVKVAGNPTTTLQQGSDTIYSFGPVTAQIAEKSGVDLITVTDSRFETIEHVRTGLAARLALSLLGQPDKTTTANGVDTLEYGGMAVMIRNNLVMQIRVHPK